MSPYPTDIVSFVERFGYTIERNTILNGLLEYRAALLATGINGYQWLCGSFLEDVEVLRGRPPSDIDVVTVFYRPPQSASDADWTSFLQGSNKNLFFNPAFTKGLYKCDGQVIDLNDAPETVVDLARFWYGLFAHQRETQLWKGIVTLDFDPIRDALARNIIETRTALLAAGSPIC